MTTVNQVKSGGLKSNSVLRSSIELLKNSNPVLDFADGLLCLITLAASVYWKHDPQAVVATSFALVIIVGIFSLKTRHNLPILLLIVLVKIIALPSTYVLSQLYVIMYYLSSALLDLIMAFCLVNYHNDPKLLKLFNVETPRNIPQVFLMALILGVSSLVSCLQSVEYLMFLFDESFYDQSPPLISSHQTEIKQALKILFDLCICSLLLDPNRWKILQKIQNKFLAP